MHFPKVRVTKVRLYVAVVREVSGNNFIQTVMKLANDKQSNITPGTNITVQCCVQVYKKGLTKLITA
jgi:hypothetical protein